MVIMCTYVALKTHQIIFFVFKYCTWKLKNLVSSRISSNFISKHGVFNWWRQGFDKFGQKWLNCLANDTRTPSRKRKNRLLDDLIRKPDKTISAARTSAIVVVLALRKHMKTLRSVSLTSDRPVTARILLVILASRRHIEQHLLH